MVRLNIKNIHQSKLNCANDDQFGIKTEFLILYTVNDEKKINAIKLLKKLMKIESTPVNPNFIIPNEKDQRMETIVRCSI